MSDQGLKTTEAEGIERGGDNSCLSKNLEIRPGTPYTTIKGNRARKLEVVGLAHLGVKTAETIRCGFSSLSLILISSSL